MSLRNDILLAPILRGPVFDPIVARVRRVLELEAQLRMADGVGFYPAYPETGLRARRRASARDTVACPEYF